MATQFYRKKVDGQPDQLINAQTQKVLTPEEFGGGAGYQELKAIDGAKYNTKESQQSAYSNISAFGNTLYGLEKPKINNEVNSNDLMANTSLNDIPEPQAPTIQNIYAENAQKKGSEFQKLAEAENTRLTSLQTEIKDLEDQLKDIETKRDENVTQDYEELKKPFREDLEKKYNEKFKVEEQIQQRIDLTQELIEYGDLLNSELEAEASRGGLTSVYQKRVNNIKETYISRISIAQAAMSAIDGNVNTVRTHIDRGINAITQDRNDQIDFLSYLSDLYNTQETDTKNKILNLTNEEKGLVETMLKDIKSDLNKIEENKEEIMSLMSNPQTAVIAHKSGINITDTREQVAEKLQAYFVANPESTDTLSLNEKISLFEKGLAIDSSGNITELGDNGIISQSGNAYDMSTYAKDPKQAQAVQKYLNDIGKFNSVEDIDNYIQSVKPGSQITGQMIAEASTQQGVGWEELVALIQHESLLGTSNVAKQNNNLGGITWNGNFPEEMKGTARPSAEGGNYVRFGSMQEGINSVAFELAKRKVEFESSADSEVDGYVELVKSGKLDEKQALDEIDKDKKSDLVQALAKAELPNVKGEQAKQAEVLVNLTEEISTHEGKNSAVGINPFARGQVPVPLPFGLGFKIPFGADYITGKNADFIGKVQQLADSLTLAKLVEVKGQGATFGALSDSERAVIERAATPINQWVVKDNEGKVVGYKIDQGSFDREIERLKAEYYSKAGLVESTSGTTANGVNWQIDSAYQTTPSGINYEIIE